MKTMSSSTNKKIYSFSSKLFSHLSSWLNHSSKFDDNPYYPYKNNFYYENINDLKVTASKHLI